MTDTGKSVGVMPSDPEVQLAIAYAPMKARATLSCLFALDERLASFVARASEPTIGLMRLIWWRDALAALDTQPPRGEPLLLAAAETELAGGDYAAMVDGWEALLDDPELGPETLAIHARARGARLFTLAARVMGSTEARVTTAGEGWALTDLARHVADKTTASAILATAAPLLADATGWWPRHARPLGMLAALAREDVDRGIGDLRSVGSRGRLLKILRFQMIGR